MSVELQVNNKTHVRIDVNRCSVKPDAASDRDELCLSEAVTDPAGVCGFEQCSSWVWLRYVE